jgi:hypothetical protein
MWGRGRDLDAESRDHDGMDLVGYDVEALDGKVGTVDEASVETDNSWLVVDTGPWILGRRVLLPAGTVDNIDHAGRAVYVDRSKALIEHSPGYDPETFGKPDYQDRVGRYYEETYRE